MLNIVLTRNEEQILKELFGRMNIEDFESEQESTLIFRLYEALCGR